MDYELVLVIAVGILIFGTVLIATLHIVDLLTEIRNELRRFCFALSIPSVNSRTETNTSFGKPAESDIKK
jgi:hypothetical protein